MRVLDSASEWKKVLQNFPLYDFYHTFDYHEIESELRGRRSHPILLVHEVKEGMVALPLLQQTGAVEGRQYVDANSVYGYAGPIVCGDFCTQGAISSFQNALEHELNELGVVSVFSRLHPLLHGAHLVAGLGDCQAAGKTVYIDLAEGLASQFSAYRSNLKRDIRKLREMGATCEMSSSKDDLNTFVSIYHRTMKKVGATPEYYFPIAYFEQIVSAKDYDMHLFVCRLDADVMCAGLFSDCCGIIQYHLGGTNEKFARFGPTKLMLDGVRQWGLDKGNRYFHLGGGLGGQEDQLFNFKRGFSRHVADFQLWKWVVDKHRYDELSEVHVAALEQDDESSINFKFFPLYRAPTVATHSKSSRIDSER
jgi:hypothetical protein